MSAALLREIAGLSEKFRKAADALAFAESLSNAIEERKAAIAKLDEDTAAKIAAVAEAAEKLSKVQADIVAAEKTAEARRAEIDAAVSEYAADAKRKVEESLGAYANARGESIKQLEATFSTLSTTVESLTAQRDRLVAEIETAKRRIAAV